MIEQAIRFASEHRAVYAELEAKAEVEGNRQAAAAYAVWVKTMDKLIEKLQTPTIR